MVKFTRQEKELLMKLLSGTNFQGNKENLTKTLSMVASIENKLNSMELEPSPEKEESVVGGSPEPIKTSRKRR